MTSLPSPRNVLFGSLSSTRTAFTVVLAMCAGLGMLTSVTGCSKGVRDSGEQQDDDSSEYDEVTKALVRKVTVLSAKKLLGKLSDEQEEDLANAKALLELRRRVRNANEREAKEEAALEKRIQQQAAQAQKAIPVQQVQQPPIGQDRFWQGLADAFSRLQIQPQNPDQMSAMSRPPPPNVRQTDDGRVAEQRRLDALRNGGPVPSGNAPLGNPRAPQPAPPQEQSPAEAKRQRWAKASTLGIQMINARRLDEALEAFKIAREASQDLVYMDPSVVQSQIMLSQSHHGIGSILMSRKQWTEANKSFTSELKILQSLRLQGTLPPNDRSRIAEVEEISELCRKVSNNQ